MLFQLPDLSRSGATRELLHATSIGLRETTIWGLLDAHVAYSISLGVAGFPLKGSEASGSSKTAVQYSSQPGWKDRWVGEASSRCRADLSLPSGKRSADEGIVAWWALEELNL